MQGDMIKKNDPECCPVLINKNDTQDLGKCEDAAPDTIKKCEVGIPNIRFRGFKDDWEQRKLGGLCDITTGKLDANAMVQDGQFDFYTSGVDVYKIDRAAFEGPAITIAGNGASVGYMHLVDGKFNAYQRTYVLTGFLADRQFLNVAIGNELPAKIQEEVRGSGIPYIVLNMLTELNIPFPSHNEQKQIGEFFRNLDHLITLHQRKCDETRALKKYMLQKMFPKDGEKVPEIRFQGFAGEWEQRKAKDLCSISTGKSNTQDRVDDGIYPFYIRSDIPVKSNKFLYDCEAVITIGDGNIGRVFHYVNGKFDLHQRCYKMTDFQDIWGKYFYYFFSTRFYERAMKMTAKATVDSVRLEMISEMDIWKPVQIDEQKQIADFFSNLDHLITLHQRKSDELKEIKQYMLQNMFPQKI